MPTQHNLVVFKPGKKSAIHLCFGFSCKCRPLLLYQHGLVFVSVARCAPCILIARQAFSLGPHSRMPAGPLAWDCGPAVCPGASKRAGSAQDCRCLAHLHHSQILPPSSQVPADSTLESGQFLDLHGCGIGRFLHPTMGSADTSMSQLPPA